MGERSEKKRLSHAVRVTGMTGHVMMTMRRKQSAVVRPKLTSFRSYVRVVQVSIRIHAELKRSLNPREKAHFHDLYYRNTSSLQSLASIEQVICSQSITVSTSFIFDTLRWLGWQEGHVLSLFSFLKLISDVKYHMNRCIGQELQEAFLAMRGNDVPQTPPMQDLDESRTIHEPANEVPSVTGSAIQKACGEIGLAVALENTKKYDFENFSTAVVGDASRKTLDDTQNDVHMQELLYHGEAAAKRLMGCRRTSDHPRRSELQYKTVDDISVIAEQSAYLEEKLASQMKVTSKHTVAAVLAGVKLTKLTKAAKQQQKASPRGMLTAHPSLLQTMKKPNFAQSREVSFRKKRISVVSATSLSDPMLASPSQATTPMGVEEAGRAFPYPEEEIDGPIHNDNQHIPEEVHPTENIDWVEEKQASCALVVREEVGRPQHPPPRSYARSVRDWRDSMTIDEVKGLLTEEQFVTFLAIKKQLKREKMLKPIARVHPTHLTVTTSPPAIPKLKSKPVLCIKEPEPTRLRVAAWLRNDSCRRQIPPVKDPTLYPFYKSRVALEYS